MTETLLLSLAVHIFILFFWSLIELKFSHSFRLIFFSSIQLLAFFGVSHVAQEAYTICQDQVISTQTNGYTKVNRQIDHFLSDFQVYSSQISIWNMPIPMNQNQSRMDIWIWFTAFYLCYTQTASHANDKESQNTLDRFMFDRMGLARILRFPLYFQRHKDEKCCQFSWCCSCGWLCTAI